MTTIDPNRTLADLVIAHPELARRFDELGLDYCCGGATTLNAAVDVAGLDRDATVADLEAVPAGPVAEPAWSDVGELVDWIEATHHAYLRDNLPRLVELADKVAGVHGSNHPELLDVRVLVHEIRADLDPHLLDEERILFPMIRELATAAPAPAPAPATAPAPAPSLRCGALSNPIRVMLDEHDSVGDLLTRLRATTRDYAVPADGCGSYQALYGGLAELETDTHRHVHLENNVLFPAVLATEQDLAAGRGRSAEHADEGGEAPCWAHLIDPS